MLSGILNAQHVCLFDTSSGSEQLLKANLSGQTAFIFVHSEDRPEVQLLFSNRYGKEHTQTAISDKTPIIKYILKSGELM